MDGSRVSDFSIERILSPQLGHKPPVMDFPADEYHSGSLRPPAAPVPVPVPVPVPACLQYQALGFGEVLYPYAAPGFHRTDFTGFYPNSGVFVHFSGRDPAGRSYSQYLIQRWMFRNFSS